MMIQQLQNFFSFAPSLVLLLLTGIGLPALSGAQQTCQPDGDVDQSGGVTAADALLAFQQALSLVQLSACQLSIADVFPQPATPDGTLTASDALCIFQKALGLPSCLSSSPPDDTGTVPEDPPSPSTGVVAGTTPGSRRLAERPHHNQKADDLLDHWGHRQVSRIREGLSLADPADGDNAEDLRTLRTAALADGETVVRELHDGDEVQVLGAHLGVTYGRWTGGPADTLSIKFDFSRLGPEMRDDPVFRAMFERAGKAWSRRIADTWSVWERSAGDLKGYLAEDGSIEVRVDAGGETSTGLEIHVTVGDLPQNFAGLGNYNTIHSPDDSWEPHFGSIAIDSKHIQDASEPDLFATIAHEIGHVLGSWMGGPVGQHYVSYTDTATGTWTGPNVAAVHGGPAPFQDASDPYAWVEGERDPSASQFDLGHSGVCASLLSYCRYNAPLPAFLPHAIDFAFLADLGLTVTAETDRPETYGLAGWGDYAAFTLSLSRDLQIALADPQPQDDSGVNGRRMLDMVDLLRVEVDAFGYRSAGGLSPSLAARGPSGTARYAGGLIGAALDRRGLPPVTGDAGLALDLGTLDGTASFTSLLVYPDGLPETFAGGALHYPFGLLDNALTGTGIGSTLRADFYGPGHEEVAGVLHDPRAGLLASFGATTDERPSREELILAADYVAGMAYRDGSAAPADDGWHHYRCDTDAACASRRDGPSDGWTDWMTTTHQLVLDATAGWSWRNASRPDADRGFVRIARRTNTGAEDDRGRHAIDGYTGTLQYTTFATGFEQSTNGGSPSDFGNRWAGFHGTLSGSRPSGLARWSGPMLGFQSGQAADANPFVEGRATIRFSLPHNRVDVLFSGVKSRDHQRVLPDFGFENLQPEPDGTFEGIRSGIIDGAFFGPEHEEATGSFYHNATEVVGGFGARRVPDTVTLVESGTVTVAGGIIFDSVTRSIYRYDQWGFWGRQFDEKVFGAFIEQNVRDTGSIIFYDEPYGRIEGTPSGHNPVSGTAVWSGKARAFDTQSETGQMPVNGDARLAVDFAGATVDVDFTDFEAGHGDMSWRSLRLQEGAFRDTQGQATIEGAFYGTEHQGVAGEFNRDSLRGVFGAVRN